MTLSGLFKKAEILKPQLRIPKTAMLFAILLLGLIIAPAKGATIERIERVESKSWYLAMNLNPADGHTMDYTTGWAQGSFIGTYTEALNKDYLNRVIWRHPVNYIAIVRHQDGEVDAVKVFRFKESSRSLLSRFQDMDPGREIVTDGGPLQESISRNAQNMADDPIFSVGGDLGFNWNNDDNGHRIVLTGGIIASKNENSDKSRGFGNDFWCNPATGVSFGDGAYGHEISNQVRSDLFWQGRDNGSRYSRGTPVYGNYAIYVSEDADNFPDPGYKLELKVQVQSAGLLLQEL